MLLWRSVGPVRFNPFEDDFLYIPNINLVLKMKKKKKQPKNKNEKTKTHHPSMNRICKPLPRWTHWQVSQASQSMILCMCIQLLGCVWLFATHGLQPTGLLCPWNFPGKNTGLGCHFLLQGIFPTTLDQTHVSCIGRWILYHLSHLGSPYDTRRTSETSPYFPR